MATELLTKFKIFVDLKSLNDWEQTTDWSLSTVNDIPSFAHTSGGSNATIKKNILTKEKKYHIKLTVKFDTSIPQPAYYIQVGAGTAVSTPEFVYDAEPHTYDYFLTCTSNSYFSIQTDTSIQLEVYNIAIEEVGYTSLNLIPDEDILLTFGVKDVKEYGQNIDTFSRVFKLPSTPTNNTFFKNIFQINEDGTFDFNQHTSASIVVDNQTIKNGIIRLDSVIKSGQFFNYEVTFLGEIMGLFADAGDTLLEELDYSDINRVIDDAWVVANNQLFGSASFPPHPEYQNFCFPYICYGSAPFEGIRGKAWDDSDTVGLLVSDLFPAIGYKYLFEKCLSSYGYTYTSSTLDNNSFDKMIVPFVNSEDKLNEWFNVMRNEFTGTFSTQTIHFNGSEATIDWTNGKFSNAIYIYSSFDGVMQTNENYGGMTSTITKDLLYGITAANSMTIYPSQPNQHIHNIIPGYYRCRKTTKYKLRVKFRVLDWAIRLFVSKIPISSIFNVGSDPSYMVGSEETIFIAGTLPQQTWGYSNSWYIVEQIIDCKKDDMIAFKFVGNAVGTGEIEYVEIDEYGYGNGSFVDFKNVVPENLKIVDFLADTFKTMNLFVKVDADNHKKLIIEDYKTFYGAGKTVNFNGSDNEVAKIDYGKEIKISTPKDFSAKQILLKYEDADNTYNKFYIDKISDRTYGHKFIKINDFNEENEKEIKLNVFTSTPLVDFGTDLNTGIRQFVYSDISTFDKTQQNITYEQNTKTTPRILFYKNQAIDSSYKKFNFEGGEYTTFPYAGHFAFPMDIDNSSQFDLNFETITETQSGVSALFFTPTPTGMTNNNLYNLYWRDYLNNYIDKGARIVECYAYLTNYDIHNIQLNDTIQIDETDYHINKIIDFNCSKNGQMTKMELIKVIDNLPAFTAFEAGGILKNVYDTTSVNNNLSVGQRNIFASGIGGGFALGEGNVVSGNSFVIGSNNTSSNGVIIGSDNVQSGNRNIVIGSNGASFSPEITGSIIIGGEGNTIKSNNTVQIGNISIDDNGIHQSKTLIDAGQDVVQLPFTNSILIDAGKDSVWDFKNDSFILIDPNNA